ncbi:MAG: hypothetical protein ACO22V_09335 [Hylemonella sp.]|jgi:hypothetical protein
MPTLRIATRKIAAGVVCILLHGQGVGQGLAGGRSGHEKISQV